MLFLSYALVYAIACKLVVILLYFRHLSLRLEVHRTVRITLSMQNSILNINGRASEQLNRRDFYISRIISLCHSESSLVVDFLFSDC